MLRLSTLGGLVLHQDGQLHTGPAARWRRLALLAVIASGGVGPFTAETPSRSHPSGVTLSEAKGA